jgi:hypothetical protein
VPSPWSLPQRETSGTLFESLSALMASWIQRSGERVSDGLWHATLLRVRSEFDEMPSLRVTGHQARMLFGLHGLLCDWVLDRLHAEGFLSRTDDGVYIRRTAQP